MADVTLSKALGFEATLVEITTPGSGTWTHPEPGVVYELVGEIIGAGGGGASGAAQTNTALTANTNGGGSGSPGVKHFFRMVTSEDVPYTVGAGGTGGAARVRTAVTTGTTAGAFGSVGGDTVFGRFKAAGGDRGQAGAPGATGVVPTPAENGVAMGATYANVPGYEGTSPNNNNSAGTQYAGEGGVGYVSGQSPAGGAAAWGSNVNTTANSGGNAPSTNYGCGGAGGGAACVTDVSSTAKTATSGAGGDGAGGLIRFYYRRK